MMMMMMMMRSRHSEFSIFRLFRERADKHAYGEEREQVNREVFERKFSCELYEFKLNERWRKSLAPLPVTSDLLDIEFPPRERFPVSRCFPLHRQRCSRQGKARLQKACQRLTRRTRGVSWMEAYIEATRYMPCHHIYPKSAGLQR